MGTRPTDDRLFWVLPILLSVLVVLVHLQTPYLPTNDGPSRAFEAYILNHYGDAGSIFPLQLVPNFQFSSRGFSLFYQPLEALFGWRTALRVFTMGATLAFAWAVVLLSLAINPRRRVLGLLGFGMAFSWQFYMGLFASYLSIVVGLLLLSYLLAFIDSRHFRWWIFGTVLFVQAYFHIFGALLTGLAAGLVLLGATRREERWAKFLRMGLASVPTLIMGGFALSTAGEMESVASHPKQYVWPNLGELIQNFPRIIAPGGSLRAWSTTVFVFFSLGIALHRLRDSKIDLRQRGLCFAALGLLFLGLVTPLDIPGWSIFSWRFVGMGSALAVVCLPLERLDPKKGRWVQLAVVVLSFVNLTGAAGLNRRLNNSCSEPLAALDAPLVRSGFRLPLVFDEGCPGWDSREVPLLQPMRHAYGLYAMAHGGSTTQLFFGTASAYAFHVRGDSSELRRPRPPASAQDLLESVGVPNGPANTQELVDRLSAYGPHYEDFIILNAPPHVLDRFVERGFEFDARRGQSGVARFVGCESSLAIALPSAFHGGIGVGVPGLPDSASYVANASEAGEGPTIFSLGKVLCGELRFRVVQFSEFGVPESILCKGADKDGYFPFINGNAGAVTDCLP